MSPFSVGFFLSRSPENFRRATILCFMKFRVSKILMEKRGEEEEGGSIKILRQFFLVSLPKNFVGEPFFVSLISGIEKGYACEGYVTNFVKTFCIAPSKNFVGEPFCVSQNFWCRQGLWKRRGERREVVSRFSVSSFLSHCRKNSRGNPLLCH